MADQRDVESLAGVGVDRPLEDAGDGVGDPRARVAEHSPAEQYAWVARCPGCSLSCSSGCPAGAVPVGSSVGGDVSGWAQARVICRRPRFPGRRQVTRTTCVQCVGGSRSATTGPWVAVDRWVGAFGGQFGGGDGEDRPLRSRFEDARLNVWQPRLSEAATNEDPASVGLALRSAVDQNRFHRNQLEL